MRIQHLFARALGGVVLTALIAGCSGNSNMAMIQAAPNHAMAQSHINASQALATHGGPTTQGEIPCNSVPNLLYVSQRFSNTVNIYANPGVPVNNPPIVTITSGQGLNQPMGMITDTLTVLYVANYGAQNVLLFKKCGTGPGSILNDAPFNPDDVAVTTGSSGAVYVSNFTAPSVTVFPTGSVNYNPALTLTDPNAKIGIGITIDKFGDCFWSFMDSSSIGRVDRFANCTMPGVTISPFTLINGPPGGIEMDFPANRMLINKTAGQRTMRLASPWTGGPFLCPLVPAERPLYLMLRNNETRLYVADGGMGRVIRYTYPACFNQPPLTNGLGASGGVTGVAVWPPAPL